MVQEAESNSPAVMNDTDLNSSKKFIVDDNLGRLAKWLRMLGFDTLFSKSASLYGMSRKAGEKGRLFLTRSRKNAGSKMFERAFLIKSSAVFEQLKEIAPILDIEKERLFTRCSICNEVLHEIEKEKVSSLVPDYIYRNNERFKKCPDCGKIYWKGTHNKAIMSKIEEIFNP